MPSAQSIFNIIGTSAKINFFETDETPQWSWLVSGGDIYIKQESSDTKSLFIRGTNNRDALSVNIQPNTVVVNGSLFVGNSTYVADHVYQRGVPVKSYDSLFCDFTYPATALSTVTACAPDYLGVSIGTGGGSSLKPSENYTMGVFNFTKALGANIGYAWTTGLYAFRLKGGESFTSSLNITLTGGGNNETKVRLGFIDINTGAAVTDGAYFNITASGTAMNVYGQLANNGAVTRTSVYDATAYAGQYVVYKIRVKNSTISNFTMYNLINGAVIWSGEVMANIPNTAGRETGAGITVVSNATTITAQSMGSIDYLLTQVQDGYYPRFGATNGR
jgi:hypothetical protein